MPFSTVAGAVLAALSLGDPEVRPTAAPKPASAVSHEGEYGFPTVSSIALDAAGNRVVASYYRAARNRPGTDWSTWVAQWDLQSGERLLVTSATDPILFSRDGKKLAMAAWERSREPGERMSPRTRLALWEFGKPEPVRVLRRDAGSDDTVVAATFASGGTRLVSMNESGEVILWELEGDDPPLKIGDLGRIGPSARRLRAAPSLSFSPTGMGSVLAIVPGGVDRATTSSRTGTSTHPENITAVVWSARGAMRRKFEETFRLEEPIDRLGVSGLSWYMTNSRLTLRPQWLDLPFPVDEARRRRGLPTFAFCHRQGHELFAVGSTGKVTLYHRGPIRSTTHLPFGSPAVALSGDGRLLATGERRGIVRVWNLDRGRFERTLRLDDHPAETFRVAAIQSSSVFGDPKTNREHLSRLVSRAAWRGAKFVVLPETSISGYLSQDMKRTWQVDSRPVTDGLTGVDPAPVAEAVPGESTEFCRRLAAEHGIYLTAPILEVDRKAGKYYNAVVLFDPHGRQVLHYRKRNPWLWAERGWVTAGNLGNPVIDTPYGRIGVAICYDIHKQAQILSDLKVDTLLYSIAWVEDADSDWFARGLPGVAQRNRLNIVGANWTIAGKEKPPWHGYGQSAVIDRKGKVLARAKEDLAEEIVFADLPLAK